jgi:hypothetical protein
MKKPKEYYQEIDIYRGGCWLLWPSNREQAEEWYNNKFKHTERQEFISLDEADAVSILGTTNVIVLTEWHFNPEWISNLTHECVHVANHILEVRGVKEEKGCDEAQAYLVGFLVSRFLTALKSIKQK